MKIAELFRLSEAVTRRTVLRTNLLGITGTHLAASALQSSEEFGVNQCGLRRREPHAVSVISHKSEQIKDRFSKVIEFSKKKKFSQMKVVK